MEDCNAPQCEQLGPRPTRTVERATLEPPIACNEVPQPTGPRHRDVQIKRVANGFVLNIGCQTFVAKTWDDASDGLRDYWKDPVAAEKKYCAAN